MAPKDIDEPWALGLHNRCQRYHVLPQAGGAYDQDEYLMTAMEHAAGASNLFDADGQTVLKFAELHTSLGEQAGEIIRCYNEREAGATRLSAVPEPTTQPRETTDEQPQP